MSHPQISFSQTSFTGTSLLSKRRAIAAKVTLRAQLDQIRSTGRYDCFKLEWHPIYDDKSMWPVPFHLFWDSDIAKWIEGACYFLQESYDPEIDGAVREVVGMIRGAQQDDGYLNLHYTVVEPEKRWSNLRDMHELYNAGHLIEAAVAHQRYYKNELLIEPMKRYIALIRKRFGTAEGQIRGYPGHPEIELALLRFYSVTKYQEAYDLAKYFLDERGNPEGQEGKHYYDWEAEKRGDKPWLRPDPFPENRAYWYCQAHLPIKEQKTIEGHSVRALYLLTAVADLVCLSDSSQATLDAEDQKEWFTSLQRLWDNMVEKKMYVTGGIGAIKQWEGFGIDYFLPQGTDEGGCYSETCASIAVIMLAERMLHFSLDAHFGDIMELCLYNNVMTAMSISGKEFTYVNQLASSEKDKSTRNDWFWCACCPPNLTRLYGSIGGYLWDYGSEGGHAFINVHLYTSAEVKFETDEDSVVTLRQKSKWPWESNVLLELSVSKAKVPVTLRLRLPSWSGGKYLLTPTPNEGTFKVERGYLVLDPAYTTENPNFAFQVEGFEPRYVSPHPYTNQRTLALARGPVIYCAEDVDNEWEKNHFKDVVLSTKSPITEEQRLDADTGEEYVALRTMCSTRSVTSGSEVVGEATASREVVFVPYYYRSNRGGGGHMRVGMVNGGQSLGVVFPEKRAV